MSSLDPTLETHDPGGKVRVKWPSDSEVTARFSECGKYRYELWEVWGDGPVWAWIMTNPSIAAHDFTDQTVLKTGKMSRLGGAGGQIILNSGAYRSTDPRGLSAAADPVGPENEATVMRLCQDPRVGLVVAAFGQPPAALRGVGMALCRKLHRAGVALHALRLSQDGTPMHPLSRGKGHIPIDTAPAPWAPPEEAR